MCIIIGGLNNYQSKLNYPDSLPGHQDAVRCIEYSKRDDYSITKLDRLNWMSDKVVQKKHNCVPWCFQVSKGISSFSVEGNRLGFMTLICFWYVNKLNPIGRSDIRNSNAM